MPKVTLIPSTINPLTHTAIDSITKRRLCGYARVSTDSDEQFTSYEAQVDYYTKLIKSKKEWEFVCVYTDEGITGTSTKKRDGFNQMIADALDGKVDLIVTKSISRFARNTVDTLVNIRMLKEKGVEVYFEKENIYTFDSSGELLLTIMSSLAQEESRSISGNVTWGKRKAFQDGKVSLPYKTFLGYKKGEDGLPQVVEKEADLVRRIYRMFISGMNQSTIARILIKEKIPTPGGKTHWQYSTIDSILRNEKYKGSALLQKRYTVDFLTKKVKKNEGEVNQYYVDESHEGIIDKDDWDIVQAELYEKEKIPTKSRSDSVLAGKIICGCCGKVYGSKVWHSTDKYRKVIWQCNNKYNGDVCDTPNIQENAVKSLYLKALGKLLDDKEKLIEGLIYVRDNVFSDDFIKEMGDTKNELDLISAGIRKHIDDNARKESDVTEYMNYYKELTIRYTRTQDKWNDLLREEVNRRMKVIKINGMIKEIRDLNKLNLEFNNRLFNLTISHIKVNTNGNLDFVFKDESIITLPYEA